MLGRVNLLAIRIPIDIGVVGTMVIAVSRILEMVNHVLLVGCCCAHIRLVGVVWREIALILLGTLLLHVIVLTHVEWSHCIFHLVDMLILIIHDLIHTVIVTIALPLHVLV